VCHQKAPPGATLTLHTSRQLCSRCSDAAFQAVFVLSLIELHMVRSGRVEPCVPSEGTASRNYDTAYPEAALFTLQCCRISRNNCAVPDCTNACKWYAVAALVSSESCEGAAARATSDAAYPEASMLP
jgi:hypothetical protein